MPKCWGQLQCWQLRLLLHECDSATKGEKTTIILQSQWTEFFFQFSWSTCWISNIGDWDVRSWGSFKQYVIISRSKKRFIVTAGWITFGCNISCNRYQSTQIFIYPKEHSFELTINEIILYLCYINQHVMKGARSIQKNELSNIQKPWDYTPSLFLRGKGCSLFWLTEVYWLRKQCPLVERIMHIYMFETATFIN